jgi:hypothetical protein
MNEKVWYEVEVKPAHWGDYEKVATFSDKEELDDCREEVYGHMVHRIVKVTETREVVE